MWILFFLASPALAAPAELLMVGNSYTQFNDLPHLVGEVLSEITGGEEVDAGSLARPGFTLADHAALATEPGPWADTLAQPWDWVVLQDQSQIPGFPEDEPLWEASRDGAVTLDGLIEPAQTVFLLTWGRRDGDPSNPELYPDFDTMQARLTEGYLAYADACGADGTPAYVAPAGWAWREVREADPELFERLYVEDGSHPSVAGSWLAALTVSRALTGRELGLTSAPPELDPGEFEVLREAAVAAVRPFEDLDYAWAFDWESYGSRVIGDAITCPTVRLAERDTGSGEVEVGAEGCGRLWVDEGGSLAAEELSVGEQDSELRLRGGDVATERLSGGRVVVEAGSLRVDEGEVSALELGEEGFLFLGRRLALGSSWTPHGTLVIEDLEALEGVEVEGTADLQGTLELSGVSLPSPAGSQRLLTATAIERASLVACLPSGAGLEIRDDGEGGRELWLVWGEEESAPEGCGCGTSGPAPWSLRILPLFLLRRRTDQRSQPPRLQAHAG